MPSSPVGRARAFTHGLAIAVLLIVSATAQAQSSTRVRGTITAVDGNVLSVKSRDGKSVDIRLGEKTAIVFTQPIALSEIRAGDFLGVTSRKRNDGTLTAFEVRRFPQPVNPGHRPFDGRDDQTMTNATVETTVQSTRGGELTLAYNGGTQTIMVPTDASISMLVPGERSHLLPHAAVSLTAAPGADGKLIAQRIQVGPPEVQPPE